MLRRWLALLPLLLVAGCAPEGSGAARAGVAASAAVSTPASTVAASARPSGATAPSSRPTAVAALLATSTAVPEATATTEATASPEETSTLAVRPTPTPSAQETADAATDAADDDLGFCRRSWGTGADGSWRGRLEGVRAGGSPDVPELRFDFADLQGDLHGVASCTTAAAWPADADWGTADAPWPVMIMLDLADWLHDDLFAASPITETIAITDIAGVEGVALAATSLDSRGVVVGIGLREPRPFSVKVDGSSVVVELAAQSTLAASDDPLGAESETADERPAPADPIYFLKDGEVYRLADGRAENISNTPEPETGLAVSPDGSLLAVCRAPADAEAFQLPYEVPSALWTLAADGSGAQQLADVGGCAEPSFDARGSTIAFTANVAPSPPARLEVWTVGLGGEPSPAAPVLDEWNRSHPRWLPDGRLIYLADDGASRVLLVRDDRGEAELTASLLSGPSYVGVGAFLVDAASGEVALEALRAAGGADLVVLRPDGTRASSERRGFYQRPLSFSDGELVYLSADCPSDAVLSYTMYRRGGDGAIDTLARGMTEAAIGAAANAGEAVVYARQPSAPGGLRGPEAIAEAGEASALWAIAFDSGERAQLLAVDGPIDAVATRR